MRPQVWFVIIGLLLLTVGSQPVRVAGATVIPAGTIVNVRTTQDLAAATAGSSMKVRAIVDDPIDMGGHIVIPRGTPATLEVVSVEQSSNMKGRDRITLKLNALEIAGRVYPVASNYVEFKGHSEGKKATRKILGGAGIGAAAGGLLGGGTGAAIGALAGGTTGAVITGSGKENLNIPAETRLQFRLNTTIRVH